MFAFCSKRLLDREQAACNDIERQLQTEQRAYDECVQQLAGFNQPRCGMERHGQFSNENKLALQRTMQQHAHAISRDQAALVQQKQKCNALEARLQRRTESKRVNFAFLTSFF